MVSTVIATILMLIITIALAGMAYLYITEGFWAWMKNQEKYCEAFCLSENLKYKSWNSPYCYCLKCETKLLLDKNVSNCRESGYNLVIE